MSQFQLLRSRRFGPLFSVQFLGAFNDNVYRFALIIFITFTVSNDSGIDARTLVVISGGVFIVPFFLFSSIAGELADKYEKSLLIQRVKFAEIVVMLCAAIGFWLESVGVLFAVLFLMGTQSTFFGPLKYGILPQHLDDDELTGGNGLIQLGTYAAILLGAIAGGMLASVDGLGPAPVVSCIVALALGGWLCSRYIPRAEAADPSLNLNWNVFRATVALLRHAAQNRETLCLILTISWFWFLGATFLSLVPSYGKELLGADEQAVTLLNLAFTLGIGIGSILCERLSKGRIELGLMIVAGIGISIFAADFYLQGEPVPAPVTLTMWSLFGYGPAVRAFIDLTLIGAFGALFIVPLYAALQARVPPTRCARVIAALNVSNALFMVASAVFTVVLFHFNTSLVGVFGVVASLNLFAVVVAAIVLPEFRERSWALCCDAIKRR